MTFALVELTGVTVYFTLPHPVAGVDAAADVHVPANTSMLTLGADGDVGVEPEDESLFPESRLQPADSVNASAIAARKRIDELPMVPPTQGACVRRFRCGNRASTALSALGARNCRRVCTKIVGSSAAGRDDPGAGPRCVAAVAEGA